MIIDDYNKKRTVGTTNYFIKLEDYRENKINEILK